VVVLGACLADLVTVILQVGSDHAGMNFLDRFNKICEVQLDATGFSQGATRRSAIGPFHAATANFFADLGKVLVHFSFGNHDSPPIGQIIESL
jgi:hypothetical protein